MKMFYLNFCETTLAYFNNILSKTPINPYDGTTYQIIYSMKFFLILISNLLKLGVWNI